MKPRIYSGEREKPFRAGNEKTPENKKRHQVHNGELNIPIAGLSSGLYLMSITGDAFALSSPFVATK